MKSARTIFKNDMLIYQPKDTLDEKILFGLSLIRRRRLYGNENSTFESSL